MEHREPSSMGDRGDSAINAPRSTVPGIHTHVGRCSWHTERTDLIQPRVDPDPPRPVGVYCPIGQKHPFTCLPRDPRHPASTSHGRTHARGGGRTLPCGSKTDARTVSTPGGGTQGRGAEAGPEAGPELSTPTTVVTPGVCAPQQGYPLPRIEVGHRHTLTPEEERDCIELGNKRCAVNREAGAKNNNFSSRPDEDISVQGVRGELAFCRMFGLPVEVYDTTPRSAATETRFDAVLPDGSRVDVKTVVRPDAPLAVCYYKQRNMPEFYALLLARDDRTIEFRGAATSKSVFRSTNLKCIRGRNGERGRAFYEVPQEKLMNFRDLTAGRAGGHGDRSVSAASSPASATTAD